MLYDEKVFKDLLNKEESEYLAKLEASKREFDKYNEGVPVGYISEWARGTYYAAHQEQIDADIALFKQVRMDRLSKRLDAADLKHKIEETDKSVKETMAWLEQQKKRIADEGTLKGIQGANVSPADGSPAIVGKRVKKLIGYAAMFNSPTIIGGIHEIVLPGAFTRSLKEREVFLLWHHQESQILGRTTSGTLKVWEDSRGLKFQCLPPDTQLGHDIVTLVERRDVKGCSFSFGIQSNDTKSAEIKWDKALGSPVRLLKDVELYEVTITAFPAYLETEVHVE